MNIGVVSKLTGLSSKSIRLYEDKGLITAPLRSESGYREYSQQHVNQLNLTAGGSVRCMLAGIHLQQK